MTEERCAQVIRDIGRVPGIEEQSTESGEVREGTDEKSGG
jgi:hypothetical protein